jgi:hypothetical protein
MSTNPNNAKNVRESLLNDLEAARQAIVELSDDQLEAISGGDGGGLEHKWNSIVRGTRYVNQQVGNVAGNTVSKAYNTVGNTASKAYNTVGNTASKAYNTVGNEVNNVYNASGYANK